MPAANSCVTDFFRDVFFCCGYGALCCVLMETVHDACVCRWRRWLRPRDALQLLERNQSTSTARRGLVGLRYTRQSTTPTLRDQHWVNSVCIRPTASDTGVPLVDRSFAKRNVSMATVSTAALVAWNVDSAMRDAHSDRRLETCRRT